MIFPCAQRQLLPDLTPPASGFSSVLIEIFRVVVYLVFLK